MKITLYELFTICDIDETDIADNTYDFIINFGCCIKKGQCNDNYDLLMRRFATKIDCDKFDIDSPTLAHCDITGFIKKNIKAFNVIMEEHHWDDYKPSSYDDIDDETFYDLYFSTFENLVTGNYSDKIYGELLKALGGE